MYLDVACTIALHTCTTFQQRLLYMYSMLQPTSPSLQLSDMHLTEAEAGEQHDGPDGFSLLLTLHPLPQAGQVAERVADEVAGAELVNHVHLGW